MRLPANRNDLLTIVAVSVLAMCMVTFDHEALGHGSVCVLSSSVFRCDVRSGWIDPAGPAVNLFMGTLALVCLRFVPARLLTPRLFLILVAAFAYFWEWGYLIRAMQKRDGDLYYFAEFLFGHVSIWQRWTAAGVGLTLYVYTARVISNELCKLWPRARAARTVARTAWISASVGAAVAALAYSCQGWAALADAVLEIGGGSFRCYSFRLVIDRSREGSPLHSLRGARLPSFSPPFFMRFLWFSLDAVSPPRYLCRHVLGGFDEPFVDVRH